MKLYLENHNFELNQKLNEFNELNSSSSVFLRNINDLPIEKKHKKAIIYRNVYLTFHLLDDLFLN